MERAFYHKVATQTLLDPKIDPAKIRAFFIHPSFARKGRKTILEACEREAKERFKSAEMMATLPGVKLYQVRGYTSDEEVEIPRRRRKKIICIRMKEGSQKIGCLYSLHKLELACHHRSETIYIHRLQLKVCRRNSNTRMNNTFCCPLLYKFGGDIQCLE